MNARNLTSLVTSYAMVIAGIVLIAFALSGCGMPSTETAVFCKVGPGGVRAPLTPEQQRTCTYGNYSETSSMFSPQNWGKGVNAPISVTLSR